MEEQNQGQLPNASNSQVNLTANKRWATVKMMPKIYSIMTEPKVRWFIFNEYQNGFHKCLRRVGRDVFIDLDDFEVWLDSHKDEPKSK